MAQLSFAKPVVLPEEARGHVLRSSSVSAGLWRDAGRVGYKCVVDRCEAAVKRFMRGRSECA